MTPLLSETRARTAAAARAAFVRSQLAAGAGGVAVAVVYLAVFGAPDVVDVVALACLALPLIWGFGVRAGAPLEVGEAASVGGFAALVTVLTAATGGLASFLLPWFVLIPAEAALARSRNLVRLAAALAAGGLALLFVLGGAGLLPAPRVPPGGVDALAGLATAAALIAAAHLAARAHAAWRTAEEAAVGEEARFRILAEHAADMITWHSADGRIAYASPAAQTLLGIAPQALAGEAPTALVHPEDRDAVHAALLAASWRREDAAVACRMRHAAGGWRWVDLRCRPAPEDGFVPGGLIAVTRDISAQKRHEADLVAAREQAEEANRAKSRFLANMSHELRTPLNAVIGFSEMIRQQMFGAVGSPRYVEYARLIAESGGHLLSLINDVLDMSKIEAGKYTPRFEELSAEDAVADALAVMRPQADAADVRLGAAAGPGVPALVADRRALKQILLNLLSNAVKFTPSGGHVGVALRRADDGVEICVADTGVGIAAQDLQRLGRPFEQVEDAYVRAQGGTGLGLALVRALAKLHGGDVEIASEVGRGTRVTVRLPLTPPRPPAAGEPKNVVYPARFRGAA